MRLSKHTRREVIHPKSTLEEVGAEVGLQAGARAGLWHNHTTSSSERWHHEELPNSPLLKLHLGFTPRFAFQSGVPEHVLIDNGFVQGNVNGIPG